MWGTVNGLPIQGSTPRHVLPSITKEGTWKRALKSLYRFLKTQTKEKMFFKCQMKLIHWIRLFIYFRRISSQVDVLQTEGHNPQLCADIWESLGVFPLCLQFKQSDGKVKTKHRHLCPSTSLNKLNHLLWKRTFQSQSSLCFNGFIIIKPQKSHFRSTELLLTFCLCCITETHDMKLVLPSPQSETMQQLCLHSAHWHCTLGKAQLRLLIVVFSPSCVSLSHDRASMLRFILRLLKLKGFFFPPLPPLIIFHWHNTELGAIRS